MNKKTVLTPLVVLALGISISYAQSYKKLMKQGEKFYKKEHFLHALPYFEKAYAQDKNSAEALFKNGVCLLNTFRKVEALDMIKKSLEMNPQVNKHSDFWLGMAYHSNLMFDESDKCFKQYQATLRKSDVRYEDCERYIKQNALARDFVSHPQEYIMRNMGEGINSYHAEHSPTISSDGKILIFTSRRESSTGHKEAPDGDFFEDIYQSEYLGNGKWSEPHSIGKYLNSSGHDASIQVYDKDSKLLLYKYTKGGDFYFAEMKDGNWNAPIRMDDLNTGSFESDAFITEDGNTIYFSSNRDSRDGTLDLYVSKKGADGKWGEAQPITELNSDFDDDSPFLSADGKTFYFSSRGWNSMGGYDVFKSEWQGDKWGAPVNMGYPINSPDDDTYYFQTSDGKGAYMASFRVGGYGDKDIYFVFPIPNVLVKGQVIDTTGANKGKPIAGITVDFTNLSDSTIAASDYTYDMAMSSDSTYVMPEETGFNANIKAARKYRIDVKDKKGNILFTEEFEIPVVEEEGTVIEKNYYLAYTDSSEIVDTTKKSGQLADSWKINNILFDFDKYDIRKSEIKELDNIIKIMKAYPDMALQLMITGHTDSKGSDEYNMELSKRRATAARNYLIAKGIEKERLHIDFKGEKIPVAPNELPDGTDNPAGRDLNRRTEFRFIDKTK